GLGIRLVPAPGGCHRAGGGDGDEDDPDPPFLTHEKPQKPSKSPLGLRFPTDFRHELPPTAAGYYFYASPQPNVRKTGGPGQIIRAWAAGRAGVGAGPVTKPADFPRGAFGRRSPPGAPRSGEPTSSSPGSSRRFHSVSRLI